MSLLALIVFGFAPSFIWLFFYLRKDKHPESNSAVLKIFFWGMLIAPVALSLELLLSIPFKQVLSGETGMLLGQPLWVGLFLVAVVPALVEEFLKYQVVGQKVLKSSYFDEPLDIMLYMVIAGLGFAAVENLTQTITLYVEGNSYASIAAIILGRFLGATLLHTLSCGIFGYFIACSLIHIKQKIRWLFSGFAFACLIHFCYNGILLMVSRTQSAAGAVESTAGPLGSMLLSNSFYYFIGLLLFLLVLAIVNAALFKRLKNQSSTCQIN